MRFVIRDDDACYFTRPERLERVYQDIWTRAPVCLATVPFAIGYKRDGIPPEHWSSGIAFPLASNSDLVAFLKGHVAAGHATIALHGFTHEDFPGGFEFQAAPDPERRLREGRDYLAEILGVTTSIFVPPHNAMSKRSIAAVAAARLNVLGSFLSFRPSMRPWDRRTLRNFLRVRRFRGATGRRATDRFVYPHVLRYARHAEFGCHSLIPTTRYEELKRGFDEARALGGDFCVATHYWEVDGRMRDVLVRLVDYAAGHDDVRFVAAEELFA
jgi:predicted deacetylase